MNTHPIVPSILPVIVPPQDVTTQPLANAEETYLNFIRPEWQATQLVTRVRKLLPVDPSMACQRLLSAAGHDLQTKIRILGLDLAKQAAKDYKLPPLETDEDLENYSTARLYDLAYRLGLLNRAEWRRMHRSYEIRRDLEHEDDQYEASVGDLIYVFETAIEVVLSREPTQIIQLRDVEEVVQSASPAVAPPDIIEDFGHAPPQRQLEIYQRLVFWALDSSKPEIVRSNCYRLVRQFMPAAPVAAKIDVAQKLTERIGRRPVDLETAQVALASGAFPFIQQRQQHQLKHAFLARFDAVKPDWRQHHDHGELLDDFAAVGGFAICPVGTERNVLRWMVTAYLGEPGRYGTWGRNRPVFYSDTAARRIEKLLKEATPEIKAHVDYIAREHSTKALVSITEQQARLDRFVEMTGKA